MRTDDPPTINLPAELLGEAGTKGKGKNNGMLDPATGTSRSNSNCEIPGVRLHEPDTFSITKRFTGRPVDVVVGTRKLWAPQVPDGASRQSDAAKGKFAGLSAETVGTGFALVLVTWTRAAAIPRVALGARAAIRSTAKKMPPSVVAVFRTRFIRVSPRNLKSSSLLSLAGLEGSVGEISVHGEQTGRLARFIHKADC